MSPAKAAAERQREIRRELDELEARMGALVRGIERDVRSRFTLSHYVRRHPVGSLIASVVAGLTVTALLGHGESRKLLKRAVRALLGQWLTRLLTRLVAEWTQ